MSRHLYSLIFWLVAAPVVASTPPPGFQETQLMTGNGATGASQPTAAAFEPGSDHLFVTEKGSRVRVRDAVTGGISTALTLPCVDSAGERGILGIAFSPDYLTADRHVFLFYTRVIDNAGCAISGQSPGTKIRVSRFTEVSGALVGEVVILEGPYLTGATNHNAGAIDFAVDGTLFVATGDNDTDANANPLSRDLGDLRGKLLRINPDGTSPADNPFVGVPGVREEIWAWGLRNPFRFRVDRDSAAPIIADVGENAWEAIYRGVAGADYGYPCVEGSQSFRACNPAPPAGSVTDPIYEYNHGGLTPPVSGNSTTGGPVYDATAFPPEYHHNYFFGDYGAGWIRRGRFAADGRLVDVELFASSAWGVVDILVAPNGCLVWVGVTGQGVREICYSGGANGQPRAVSTASPTSGLSPLNVQFIGSGSTDPDLHALTFAWDFEDPPASSNAEDPAHLFTTNGVYDVVLTVDDQQGESNSTDSAPTIEIVVGNRAPMPTIAVPGAAATYDAGDTINFSGGATDPEEGALAAGRLSWTAVFHHDTHTHPFLGPLSGIGAGSFTVPTTGEDSADVFYRVYLSATDTGSPLGSEAELTTTTFVDVTPNVSELTLAAMPAASGLELEFDRQPAVAPFTEPSVVNFPRTLGTTTPQTTGAGTFFFQSWSDGGDLEHPIVTPAGDTTYTATFAPCVAAVDDLVLTSETVSTVVNESGCLTVTAGTAVEVLLGGVLTLQAAIAVTLEDGFSVADGGELVIDLSPPI